jgi:hypothetical protein
MSEEENKVLILRFRNARINACFDFDLDEDEKELWIHVRDLIDRKYREKEEDKK